MKQRKLTKAEKKQVEQRMRQLTKLAHKMGIRPTKQEKAQMWNSILLEKLAELNHIERNAYQ